MTVSTTASKAVFNCNGVTTVFPFSFPFIKNSDIKCYWKDANGILLQLATNQYTVTGAGSPSGGSVTVSPALTEGSLVVAREMTITQGTDLRNQGKFFAQVHEDVFDRMTMQLQQLDEQVKRSVKTDLTGQQNPDDLIRDLNQAAANAQGSATAASASASSASSSASSASDHKNKAQQWADNPEDSQVEQGRFSAMHWALKAMAALSGLVARVTALENIGKPFTKEYVSPQQSITAGGLMTLSHGLGSTPKSIALNYVCKVAYAGYAIGDVIDFSHFQYNHTAGTAIGFSVDVTPTSVLVRCGTAGPAFFAVKGSGTQIDLAGIAPNFDLVVRALA